MRIRPALILAAVLAAAVAVPPASAAPPDRRQLAAPYDCAIDEAARQTGLLVVPKSLPRAPSQASCGAAPVTETAIWTSFTAAAAGFVTVETRWSGISTGGQGVCAFAAVGKAVELGCRIDASIEFRKGDKVFVGAFLQDGLEPAVAVLHGLVVTVF